MNKIKEQKALISEDVVNICKYYDWYTYGTVEEYETLLQYVDDNSYTINNDKLFIIASDIYKHSDMSLFFTKNSNEVIASMMGKIAGKIHHMFIIEEV